MSSSAELRLQPDASRYTLARFFDDVTSRHAERPAIRFEDRELSYADLRRETRLLAGGLVGAGLVKGARVAVLMANRPEWIVSVFAASLVGAVVIPVNTFAAPGELDYVLRHCDASMLLMQRSLLKHTFLEDLVSRHSELRDGEPGRLRCGEFPQLRSVYCLGLDEIFGGVEIWDELVSLGDDVPDSLLDVLSSEIEPADDALIIYTSGTTAHPKGVLHSQRAPVIQSWRFAEHYGLNHDDVVWTAQPFFWTAGIAMSLGATFAAGGCLVLQETFDAEAALARIEAERATTVHAWPHQEKAMAEHPSAATRDLTSLRRLNFSSPLAPLAGIEKDEWGTSGYGLSETFTLASAIAANAPANLRSETSGLPLPGMQVRILDVESGEPVARGESGEIALKGLTFMRGYYKVEPEHYLDADGFFHTQDGGSLDADGFLHWTGRLSNLIKTGGANVSPLEIEAALGRYPGLRVGLAVGVPHPVLGEVIVLCAVPMEGASVVEADVRAFLRERLAAYKVPKRVLFFSEQELSFTGNQKIQVGPLREKAMARLSEEGAEIEGVRYGQEDGS